MGLNLPFIDLGRFVAIRSVQAGYEHSCALLEDGGVKCWGRGDDGRLGQGDTRSRGNRPMDMGDYLPPIPF
jgi:alpha-tubulin suppressor-like RCC1 family protein